MDVSKYVLNPKNILHFEINLPMKIGVWYGLLLVALDLSIYFTPSAECFTIPVSVSTGMAIIIALVKVKAIIVKILLGLRALGVEGFVWRRRRRDLSQDFENLTFLNRQLNSSYQDDLIAAWQDLQKTAGKVIEFDLDSCTNSSNYPSSRSQVTTPWDELETAVNSNLKKVSIREYSLWVSKVLGSLIGDPLACQILQEELIKITVTSPTSTNKLLDRNSTKPIS